MWGAFSILLILDGLRAGERNMHTRIGFKICIFCILGSLQLTAVAASIGDRSIDASGYPTGISPGLELLIDQKLASKLPDEAKQAVPRNEIGVDVNEAYVNDLTAYWNYSSMHYYRLTDGGKFGGHFNYAKRYGTTGKQFQLEAYPKFSKNIYGTFSFSYANQTQYLYPNLQYIVEGYIDVAHGLEFSLGQSAQKFIRFNNQKIFNYTGTIGKYFGDSFAWLRPHYYTPVGTQFYEVGIRHYFSDTDNYISFIVGAGRLPDIGDLPPLDQMIIISQRAISMSGQFALTKTVFIQYGAGYAKQHYPSHLLREVTDGRLGMIWKF